MNKEDFFTELHRRLAQTTIGAQAMRNQGAPGMVETCRDYLQKKIIPGDFFRAIRSKKRFEQYLDAHTTRPKGNFPKPARNNWGAARKALNLFFRELAYNVYFARQAGHSGAYSSSRRQLRLLEVPLDSHVAGKIVEDAPDKGQYLQWPGIRKLKKRESKKFQEAATSIAKTKKTARVHLDLIYWRNEKKEKGKKNKKKNNRIVPA